MHMITTAQHFLYSFETPPKKIKLKHTRINRESEKKHELTTAHQNTETFV